MAGGIGGFMAGIEGLEFVERASERFRIMPRTFIRAGGLLLALVLALLLWLGATQGGWFAGEEAVELEFESSTTVRPSTNFDEGSLVWEERPVSPPVTAVVVYVTGAVESPGLYTLQSTQRIGDAVVAAGGLKTGAAQAVVNFAEPLSDGMQIHIPHQDEVAVNAPESVTVQGKSSSESSAKNTPLLVNINTADSKELQTLDGIGPATAERILAYRAARGPFGSKEELKEVSGIGEKKYAAIEAHITV